MTGTHTKITSSYRYILKRIVINCSWGDKFSTASLVIIILSYHQYKLWPSGERGRYIKETETKNKQTSKKKTKQKQNKNNNGRVRERMVE